MLESASAVLRAEAIAATAAQGRLAVFIPGTNDLSKEILRRLDVDREVMRPYLALLIAAARAHGLTILDSVFNAISDASGFEAECREGRRLGFDGKALIHPSQIETANRIYGPSAEEIAEAMAILAAFDLPENQHKGAIALDGRMVERLHLDIARRIVDDARAATEAENASR
jgi:citrate lyase subunit beta/citryl-CoA lyase